MTKYAVHVRLPLTATAKNAGATGRKHWWALAGYVTAKSKRAACAHFRKGEWYYADKLKAERVNG